MKNQASTTYGIAVAIVIVVIIVFVVIPVMAAIAQFFTANPAGLPGMLGISG